jgi:hypothetical protein
MTEPSPAEALMVAALEHSESISPNEALLRMSTIVAICEVAYSAKLDQLPGAVLPAPTGASVPVTDTPNHLATPVAVWPPRRQPGRRGTTSLLKALS